MRASASLVVATRSFSLFLSDEMPCLEVRPRLLGGGSVKKEPGLKEKGEGESDRPKNH